MVLLYPPLSDYGWTTGRIYEHMVPTLTLDRVMSAGEAAAWRARVIPVGGPDRSASVRGET